MDLIDLIDLIDLVDLVDLVDLFDLIDAVSIRWTIPWPRYNPEYTVKHNRIPYILDSW